MPGFRAMCKLKPSETVVFSYIVFRDRKHRDRVNSLVMKDRRMAGMGDVAMPMDIQRMAYAGFKVAVDVPRGRRR